MHDMMQYQFKDYSYVNGQLEYRDSTVAQKIEHIKYLYNEFPDKLDLVKTAMLEFGVEMDSINNTIDTYGEKLFRLPDKINDVRTQYGIEESPLKLAKADGLFVLACGSECYGDDTYVRVTDQKGNVFKFDRETLDLVTLSTPDKTINVRDGITTKVDVDREFKIELPDESLKYLESLDKSDRLKIERQKMTPTQLEVYINKATGEEISHQKMTESKDITGEYEIYSYDAKGNKHLIGLAEMDENGGKHVEKHLTSLDGTVTDTVFASDKEGQTFLYYRITDSKGNVEYESSKKHKIIDDNHYITSEKTNGKELSHDIQISDDKVTITKLDERGNKTSEVVEFNIADFSDDTYKQVNEAISTFGSDAITELNKIMRNEGYNDYTVDRRLLPLLKKMSGKQWVRMKENGTKFLVSGSDMQDNAASLGGFITVSEGQENRLFVFLHESGHERFAAMDLAHDEEINKIYEEEKARYTATFPDDLIAPIEYFLFANNIAGTEGTENEGRGRNEGVAETNALTETYQEWDMIQGRTALWQQFFPHTIAKIAERLEECSK